MKEILKIVLSMMVISIMLVGFAGAGSTDSTQNELLDDEYYFPEYGTETLDSLMEKSDVIEVRGTLPEITDDKEKAEWLDSLTTCTKNSSEELSSYVGDGGPLFGYGISYEGYIFVEFDEGVKNTIDESTIDELYSIIENNAEKSEISEVPVVFRDGVIIDLDSRTERRDGMIGGIQILYNNLTLGWRQSTLSFSAEDSSGTKGFVISGHAAIKANGIGGNIYQGSTTRQVGEVDYLTLHFADAAWVEADNIEDDIYYDDDDDIRDVSGYTDPSLGNKVYKSGINTSLTYGYVTTEYVELDHPDFGSLYEQFTADYSCGGGDSGGPVFRKSGSNVRISGVHWGHNSTSSFFSPVSGVILDLGVTPIY